MPPQFSFDPAKSASNQAKHGIDFEEVQVLWSGRLTKTQLSYPLEPRSMVVGRINQKFWSAIITQRHEEIRIISVRRSRKNEIRTWRQHHESGRDPNH
ncbi:BrnT family toxin [Puniceicoccales bacterium CK1056]|uniref:BrnT family toxin n=1 Tax=Oceanipulchritudo coccoides TaxID=2706888 RepID=A0A6B2M2P9_9BACT|nr:BrnT family toxin [Oceanipulchritudo coccoides]NDV63228.1 BrnT family toxin [Oceanipulchritudo coccoides]